jgi:hypothetical protein
MESLKYRYGPPCPTTLRSAGGYPCNNRMAVSGVVVHKAGNLRRHNTPLDTPCHTALDEGVSRSLTGFASKSLPLMSPVRLVVLVRLRRVHTQRATDQSEIVAPVGGQSKREHEQALHDKLSSFWGQSFGSYFKVFNLN